MMNHRRLANDDPRLSGTEANFGADMPAPVDGVADPRGFVMPGAAAPDPWRVPSQRDGAPAGRRPVADGRVGDTRRPVPPGAARPVAAKNPSRAAGRVVLIVVLAVTAVFLLTVSPLFAVKRIEVSGNQYYDQKEIVTRSGLRVGQNGFASLRGGVLKAFALRCAAAEDTLLSECPYVKTAQIRYRLPNTVEITVEERNKSVVVPHFDSGLLIDEEGIVVDVLKNYSEAGLPVASGLAFRGYEIGRALAVDDGVAMERLLAVVNALRQADRGSDDVLAWKLREIDVGDPENVTLKLDGGITVNLGDGTDIYYRVSATKEIAAYGLEEGEAGTIVFSNGAKPVFSRD